MIDSLQLILCTIVGFPVIGSLISFRTFLNYFDPIFLSLSKGNSQLFHVSGANIITIAVNGKAIFATLVCPCSLVQMEAQITCHLS